MSYKIKTLGPNKDIQTKYGQLKVYSVQLEGSDDWVAVNQKPDSPALTVGQELDGTIEDTQYGKRFKKAQGPSASPGRAADPDTRASIERQAALKAAVDAVRDYSQLKGFDGPLEQYVGRIANVAKVFASVAAGSSVKAEKDPVEVVKDTLGGEEVPPSDSINLEDIPF